MELIDDVADGVGDRLSFSPEALDGVEVITGSASIREALMTARREPPVCVQGPSAAAIRWCSFGTGPQSTESSLRVRR